MLPLPEWFDLLGIMRWPLALCVVLCVAAFLERVVFTCRSRLCRKDHMRKLTECLNRYRNCPKSVRDDAAELLLGDMQRDYLGGVRLLRVIGTVSPLAGLLGTIFGIIAAFRAIAAATGPVSPSLIAGGLWEAMLTTAVGLVTALAAFLAAYGFHYFGERELTRYYRHANRLSMSFALEQAE